MMTYMDFGKVWTEGIRFCISNSTISVLVNGSLTNDFMIHKGLKLKQGHPLSQLIFLIFVEGLVQMVKKVASLSRKLLIEVNPRST